ncbi:hypothetical protein [Mycobacterium sp.]|uniref:hypothetical protein n=1 Tax=Mycobacterium sp. TaxID=1785 RepID=UPI003F9717E4
MTDWYELSPNAGVGELPRILTQVFDDLPPDQRIVAIGETWTTLPQPLAWLRRDQWLAMFAAAGYHDGTETAKPPDQITLYRGGIWKARMSWTGNRKVAERFRDAHQVDHTRPSKLWTVTVGPDRLLAHYHLKPRFRYEDEYVINPIGLRPREAVGR